MQESTLKSENLTKIYKQFMESYPIELWKTLGFFKEDYIKQINLHWLKFAPAPKENHFILAILYIIVMIIGLFANGLLIFIFFKSKSLRSPANTLVLNLAISDFLIMSKMPIFIINSFFRGPALGDLVCRIYGFIGGLSGTVSICTLTVIAFDRYYVVKYPLNRSYINLRIKISIIVVWIYGLVFSSIPLINVGMGVYVPEGYLTSCSFDYLTDNVYAKYFIFIFFVAVWLIPLMLILFSYVNIVRVVFFHKKLNVESVRHIKEEEVRKQELHLTLVVCFVIGIWILAWTPYSIVALLGITNNQNYITPTVSVIPALFCKTASCIDPFVYGFSHPKFRSELKRIFLGCFFKRQQTTERYHSEIKRCTAFKDEHTVCHEIISTIKIPSRQNSKISSNTIVESTSAETVLTEKELINLNVFCRQSWWFKPSFSNRNNFRGMVRTLSKKEK